MLTHPDVLKLTWYNSLTSYVMSYFQFFGNEAQTVVNFIFRKLGWTLVNKPIISSEDDYSNIRIDFKKTSDEPKCKKGSIGVVNYTGTFLNSGKVFDSNIDPKFHHVTPFQFKIGTGVVINCWDYVTQQMSPGSIANVLCPYETAYGESQVGNIPPETDLTFMIEMVSCKW